MGFLLHTLAAKHHMPSKLCDGFVLGRSPLNIRLVQMNLLACPLLCFLFAFNVLQPCYGADPFEDAASLPVRQRLVCPTLLLGVYLFHRW